MSTIPQGNWAIECVLINEETVMNSDTVRGLKILKDEWVIQPVGQRFRIRQSSGKTVVLESEGEVYFADFEVNGCNLKLNLSRQNVKETLMIEATAINADVYVDSARTATNH